MVGEVVNEFSADLPHSENVGIEPHRETTGLSGGDGLGAYSVASVEPNRGTVLGLVTGAGGVGLESAPPPCQYEVRAWLRSWGPGADERGYANLAILVSDLREGFAFFAGQAVYGFETRRVE